MTRWTTRTIALAALLVGCGGDEGEPALPDGGAGDGGQQLYRCDTPGEECNPHDPCSIEAECGEDRFCRPLRYQNCDDELDCTDDVCLGNGKCSHNVTAGCVVLVAGEAQKRCVAEGAVNPEDPCTACVPLQSTTKYTARTGIAPCDDGNPCTIGDVCLQGRCEGRQYSCGDPYGCTEDTCDGLGGCTNELKQGFCLIGGTCHADQERSESGCEVCDAANTPREWTAVSNVCRIGTRCFAAGAADVTGCGVCDPTRDASGWSEAEDVCRIDGPCVAAGVAEPSGCGVCDPAQSKSAYTPPAGQCLIDGACVSADAPSPTGCGRCDPALSRHFWSPAAAATATTTGFEGGLAGYVVDPPAGSIGWQVTTRRAHGGSASLYFGDPQSGNLDDGAAHQGTAQSAPLALPAGQKAAAILWMYLDIEASPQHDLLAISANGAVLWSKDSTTVPATRYRTWFPVELDLSAFAGQSVTLTFAFDTVDAWANAGEGVFLDDVTVITGCGPL